MQLSADKKVILKQLITWYRDNYHQPSYITIGGYAGTGKTTLIALLRSIIHKKNPKLKIAFVSFTGKATQVMQTYLKKVKAIYPQDFVGTIHSLIYTPRINKSGVITSWEKKPELEFDLIIIDEASMVSSDIWQDLSSFEIPVMAFGDHGQLPPIHGKFSLMSKPDLKLEKIHRQMADNPIIKVSIFAREQGKIPVDRYSKNVIKFSQQDPEAQEQVMELINQFDQDTLILCGYNWTRVKLNQDIRNCLGFMEPTPQSGDRVICLRNNHTQKIYNGMLGTVQSIQREDEQWYHAEIKMDDREEIFAGLIAADQFNSTEALNFSKQRSKTMKGDLFDFGYALTVHKAQGSQAKRVILFEQRFSKMTDDNWRRWLYTAVTRAEQELYIVGE
ncbi:MAG: Uncharacterized protein XD93_1046 [candidate division WS6 bacterium 34_10]|uniref:UvrD-like helicase C-terminal domain-containing protein n=1 Tax=candidate division WS6 bacterium 34_10 TaxID=1641389 RepID=A0A117LZK1_9BACT|nr:MAG: Uncharacterized protein XD93_1046 [candidate division WS6 bacterium 34_10]